jgi:hypothetical protein
MIERIADDDEQRREQAERRGGLDPAGVEAALTLGRMFGDIGRGAAIFAAEREALRQPQHDQDHRRATPIDA